MTKSYKTYFIVEVITSTILLFIFCIFILELDKIDSMFISLGGTFLSAIVIKKMFFKNK